jgi:hypothetical protein
MSTLLTARRAVGSLLPAPAKRRLVDALDGIDFVKHITPNILNPVVPVPDHAKGWLKDLREVGITRVESPELIEVANILDRDYLARLSPGASLGGADFEDPRLFATNCNAATHAAFGIQIACWLSFKDERLKPLLRDPAMAAVLYNYYHRQPYYRNQPNLQYAQNESHHNADEGNGWHSDRYRQVTAMLLISDVTEQSTHMEYVTGSHKRSFMFMREGIQLSLEESKRRAEQVTSYYNLIGKKGTLFVFDATGVHRRNLILGTARKALFWTVTTGHHMHTFTETPDNWPELQNDPVIVRRMFDKAEPRVGTVVDP